MCVWLPVSRLVKQQSLELGELQPLHQHGEKVCPFPAPFKLLRLGQRGVRMCVQMKGVHISKTGIFPIADYLFIKDECKL